jgi:hypothetical protein
MDEAAERGRRYRGRYYGRSDKTLGDEMSEILKLFPTVLTRLSMPDPFLSVAIFCAVGMLASILLLVFDQNLFSMWTYP